MAQKKPNRRKDRKRQSFLDAANEPTTTPAASELVSSGRRWYLIGLFVVIALGGTFMAQALNNQIPVDVARYTYEVVRTYPHDPTAFTQGLYLEDGVCWESTGKEGKSTIRKYDLASGKIIKNVDLPPREFGEGCAVVGDRLYQLTWKNGICHVYDRELNKIKDFEYRGQGWGLTYDGTDLIMSDGTSRIYFIDPETFENKRMITVQSGRKRIDFLNELEYTGGKIYANRWRHDTVYEIDPKTGKVLGIINLAGLWPNKDRPSEGVLNGIAVDSVTQQVIVTGKYCPEIYEIKLIRRDNR